MGGFGSGRKTVTYDDGSVSSILHNGAPFAAKYLIDVIKGEIKGAKKPSQPRIEASKYVINQVLGTPKQKIDITTPNGEPMMTYQAIIVLAEEELKRLANTSQTILNSESNKPLLTDNTPCNLHEESMKNT
jgi:hypothetical protein